jgi:internalin A
MSAEIYISYAWGGESENLVDEIDKAFSGKNISIIRDKRDLGYNRSITDFMKQIGQGKAVIIVISDKYLRSPNCMFELMEIYRNLNFRERIFPVVLPDAGIFDPITRLSYLKFWKDKKQELDDAISTFGSDAITVIGEDYKTYKKIFDNFGEIANILKDINSLTPQMHKDLGFDELLKAVELRITPGTKEMDKEQADGRILPSPAIQKSNTIISRGNDNIIIQDIDSGGNITINK